MKEKARYALIAELILGVIFLSFFIPSSSVETSVMGTT
ncbi:Uncharacterised protein [Lactobacillus paragasseri]|nr:Uncharacterised protein [Lactobacillus paragasseri]